MCIHNHSYDLVSEIPEHSTLKMFGHVVTNHIPCGKPDYWNFTITNPIGDKEITNVNVIFPFADLGLPIIFQINGTISVMVHTIEYSDPHLNPNSVI